MSAHDWLYERLTGACISPDKAKLEIGAHRVEVLRDATAAAVAERLTDATGQPDDVAYNRAIEDVVDALTRLTYGERSDAARAFFQPGHTYAQSEFPQHDWRFRCDTVTTHPEDGERTALGWRFWRGNWEAYAYAEDDWEVHLHVGLTDVTKEAAR
ncbi:hypothetical protein [Streptomyces rubradiris]|uniref:SnoaL-like domain-containing protein n=1 Tax=Streptomyces rubradiris TaxID=285531 RepID=A0ABQ3R3D8_STRRR|nr:hypothetical protein [Streptomyces rubradiris]GHH29953.1 hypothetical protein GCM10018792_75730 [Streptomyces rubradiris]GHI50354.1 hypothetical protein Srubr_02000 [Streptomyces rubradiris]